MNRVWAWQDVETADHNLKESEEWKVLSKKKDLSKAVLFHPTTNYWNTLTGIVTNTTVDIWNQQTYTLNSYKVQQAPPGMGVYPSPLLHPHPHPQHTHIHTVLNVTWLVRTCIRLLVNDVISKWWYQIITSKHLQHMLWTEYGRHLSGIMVLSTLPVWLPSFWNIKEKHILDGHTGGC